MKTGTDAVLLGAWADVEKATSILDIGTGSGLIALILAQRTSIEIKIDAVEIEEEDASQAKENVAQSPWPDKIQIHNTPIQEFKPGKKYNLIVSNPPFFNNSMLPPSDKRKSARHTQSLSYDDLLYSVKQLIMDDGIFAIVLPVKEGNAFISQAQFHGLYCRRQLAIYTREGKPQERWLIELSRTPGAVNIEKLVLYDQGQERSDGYKKLTSDFYLQNG